MQKEALDEIAQRKRELTPFFNANKFDRNHARKLFRIKNAIFDADLRPIAVPTAKLQFFIALICGQMADARAENQGVIPLPDQTPRLLLVS